MIGRMNWKKLIQDLIDSGLTQSQIATKCGCAQSTISELFTIDSRAPGFALGSELVELHKRAMRKQRAKAAA